MVEENKAVVRRWFEEVWNKGNIDVIHEILAPGAVVHNLPTDTDAGRTAAEQFIPLVQKFRGAMPDLHISVDDLLGEEDKIVARCTVRGTHQGDALGFAPTGIAVDFTGISIVRLRDGQFVEGWNNFDFMAMFQQLGVLPPSES